MAPDIAAAVAVASRLRVLFEERALHYDLTIPALAQDFRNDAAAMRLAVAALHVVAKEPAA